MQSTQRDLTVGAFVAVGLAAIAYLSLQVGGSSHHMASSLRMGHRLVLLGEHGAVSGTPEALASNPDSRIREFLGADGHAFLNTLGLSGEGAR